jgi:hypothetical protein
MRHPAIGTPACVASTLTNRGRRGSQWNCCGSCAIRSLGSHGGNLPPRSAALATKNGPARDKNGSEVPAATGSAPPAPRPDAAAAIPPAELLPAYRAAAAEREALVVPPLPVIAP